MRRTLLLALICAGSWGCGDGDDNSNNNNNNNTPDAGHPDAAEPDGPPPDVTITGNTARRGIVDGPAVVTPIDVTGSVSAIVVDSTGTATTYPATGHADGSFTITLPPGTNDFFLEDDNAGFLSHSSALKLDLGWAELGRPDVAPIQNPTDLTFALTGMAPWTDDDLIEMFSAGAASFARFGAGDVESGAPVAGDTALSATIGWADQVQPNVISGAAGDVAWIDQLSAHVIGADEYYTLSRSYATRDLEQTDGTPSRLPATGTAALVTPPTELLELDFRRSAFASTKTLVNPTATDYMGRLVVGAAPGYLEDGWYMQTVAPSLVFYTAAGPGMDTDLDLGLVAFGNPFPPTWGVFGVARWLFEVDFLLAGTTTPAQVFAQNLVVAPAWSFGAGPIAPRITPVRSPKLNGTLDATVAQTGVSTTPTVSWLAPTIGAPCSYSVSIFALVAHNTTTKRVYVTSILTGDTTLRIPPGVLESGQSYVFRIEATSGLADPTANPLRSAQETAEADLVTGMITP
jgi:hypothetical protein